MVFKHLILFVLLLNKDEVTLSQKIAHQDFISDRMFSRETLPECPDSFTDTGTLCYFLTKKSSFTPKCPFKDVLPFDSYKTILLEKKLGPVWMPVQRNLTNGLGFLQWIEVSPRYKTVFNDSFFYGDRISGKDCLVFYNSSYIVATSCEEQHIRVCAYKKLDLSKNFLCDDDKTCVYSSLSFRSKCVCVSNVDNLNIISAAQFLEPYQNRVYDLLNEVCTIALKKNSNGSWVWSSGIEATYSFWSPEANFSLGDYAALTSNGWIVTKTPLACSFITQDAKNFTPSLNLTLSSDQTLILNVSLVQGLQQFSSDVMVYCFTDAAFSSFLYRYSNLMVLEETSLYTVYSFKPLDNSSGCYWCEAVQIFTWDLIQSNVIFFEHDSLSTKGSVVHLKYSDIMNPLSPDVFGLVQNKLSNLGCVVKIMKISDIDEDSRTISLTIRTSCEQNATYNRKKMKFNVLDYCSYDYENGLSWPSTEAGKTINPYQYCFKEDGFRLNRTCIEDATNGAYWEEITETCKIADSSIITEELSNALQGDDNNATVYKLHNMLNFFDILSPLDVYLIASFLDALGQFYASDINGTVVGEIIDTMLNINPHILIKAQQEMRATDLILFGNWELVITDGDNYLPLSMSNFVYVPLSTILTLDNSSMLLPSRGTKLEDLLTTENLKSGIFVNHNIPDDVFGITLYIKDIFFVDELTNVSHTIFGFHSQIRKSRSFSEYLVSVFYTCNEDTFEYNISCVIWGSNYSGRSAWVADGIFQIKGSYCVCSYWTISYYTLKLTTAEDITSILEEVLNSNAPAGEIISRLYQATFRHDEFSSFDVYLVGQILKKISWCTDIDLELLSKTINNLQKIDRDVLFRSQIEKTATDTILHYTDIIIQNTENQSASIFSTDSFLSLIYDMNSTDFSGCVLFENGTVEILTGLVNISSLLKYENMTSALVFSPQMKNEVKNDKVVLNIFLTDVFFNEKKSNFTIKEVSNIFDVVLPGTFGNYSGPISIFHRVKSEKDVCSYWFYDVDHERSGVWKADDESKNFSSLVQCDFWHTTHFALLIIGKDKYHDDVLEWMTNVTCCLSLLGYVGIVMTAVLFKNWRTKTDTKVLLNFVCSGMLQIIVFYIAANVENETCIVTGAVLHYSVLAQFCWMLNIAFFQYNRFVLVFGSYSVHIVLRTCLFAWGMPLIPVTSVLVLDVDSYTTGSVGLCYPSEYGLYLGVWMPICVIIVINFIIFIRIIYSVVNTKSGIAPDNDGFMYQWRLVIFLFFILGLTWSFAFLAEIGGGVVFVYLFCMLATLQGIVMFVFFILLNKNVRKLYQHILGKKSNLCGKKR